MVTLPLESIREIVLPLKLETKIVAAWAVPAIEAKPKARKRATTAPFKGVARWSLKAQASGDRAPDQALAVRIRVPTDGPSALSEGSRGMAIGAARSRGPEGVA